jgi:hypothetical protein
LALPFKNSHTQICSSTSPQFLRAPTPHVYLFRTLSPSRLTWLQTLKASSAGPHPGAHRAAHRAAPINSCFLNLIKAIYKKTTAHTGFHGMVKDKILFPKDHEQEKRSAFSTFKNHCTRVSIQDR